MTPTTKAGRALLADWPRLGEMEYGQTGEPIIAAIEAEAAQAERERIRASLTQIGYADIPAGSIDAILAEPTDE